MPRLGLERLPVGYMSLWELGPYICGWAWALDWAGAGVGDGRVEARAASHAWYWAETWAVTVAGML